ncbi:MAG: LPD29 domain-containing protein [Candidatus Bathyarchaeia archaeon]
MRRLKITEAAKLLRKELRKKFPSVKFSVRIERFSMGESIDVRWLDGPATVVVDAIVDQYSDIDRDPATGEILSGGNRYANTARKYSPEIQSKVTEEFNAGKYPGHPTEWNVLCMTDFYPGKAPRTYSREDIAALKEGQVRGRVTKEIVARPEVKVIRVTDEAAHEILDEARRQVLVTRYIQ